MRDRLIKFTPFAIDDDDVIAVARGRCCKHLPLKGAPWRVAGSLGFGAEVGPKVDATCQEIFAAIEKDGYFIGRMRETPLIEP